VISYKPELIEACRRGLLDGTRASLLEGAERREPFSLFAELRLLAWLGVLLITTGVGVFVKENFDRIGPLVLALLLGAAAVGALGFAAWRRRSGRAGIVDDYLVLLGALLASADVAFIETQFKLFDTHWQRHLLLLAFIHALIAYLFDSRSVLTLSISSMAAWVGIEQRLGQIFSMNSLDLALRSLACAAAMLVWREADRRWRRNRSFEPLFEHFAVNFAFFAAMALLFEDRTRLAGAGLALVLAAAVFAYSIRARREAFAIYAMIYGVIAADAFVLEVFNDGVVGLLFITVSTIAAIVALFLIHAHFRASEDA